MKDLLNRVYNGYNEFVLKNKLGINGLFLYEQIHLVIKEMIMNNDIPMGCTLPSTRLLSKKLGVSRSSIIKSYELLLMKNLIETKIGSGYKVKESVIDKNEINPPVNNDKFEYPSLSETGKSFLNNKSTTKTQSEKNLAFLPGLPPLDIFPVNQWKNLTNLYWREIKASALSYSASSGLEQLKKNLADYLNFTRNIKCNPKQIIIVSGSIQSNFLIGNIILNPGDYITIENPTFPNVINIFKGLRANIQTVSIDDEGLKVDELTQSGHLQSKIIHTVPSCHYPTGIKMSLNRRLALLKWASENKCLIIENDYEHEINNQKDNIPSIFSLDTEQRTIFLGTFNRLLHPSIRIGYMIVPFHLLEATEAMLKQSHRFVPSSTQVVLSRFIERNYLYRHIKNVIEISEERERIFRQCFENTFEKFSTLQLEISKTKSLHVLATLKQNIKDYELVEYLAQHNILSHPYSECFSEKNTPPLSGLIMGYTPIKTPVIKQKIIQMENLYKKFPL